MATPPFEPDETKPASSDLISAFPAAEQTFRDIIEDWLLTLSTSSGVLKAAAFPTDVAINGDFTSGAAAGAASAISGFHPRLAANSTGNTSVQIESTNASSVGAVLFNIGTTAFGQIRYLHASEDMTFYTNGSIQMTLDDGGLEMVAGNVVKGNLVHPISGGYLLIGAYDSDVYGNGTGRVWYNYTDNKFTFQDQSNNLATIVAAAYTGNGNALTGIVNNSSDQSVGGVKKFTGSRLLVGDTDYTGTDSTDPGINLGGTAGVISATAASTAVMHSNRTGSNGAIHVFYKGSDSNQVGSISVTTTATTYNTTSDARKKENARDFDSGAIIDAIPMQEFDWRDGSGTAYGPLVDRELASYHPVAFTHDEANDLWMADYSKLVPVLWHEVAKLRARVKELEG